MAKGMVLCVAANCGLGCLYLRVKCFAVYQQPILQLLDDVVTSAILLLCIDIFLRLYFFNSIPFPPSLPPHTPVCFYKLQKSVKCVLFYICCQIGNKLILDANFKFALLLTLPVLILIKRFSITSNGIC